MPSTATAQELKEHLQGLSGIDPKNQKLLIKGIIHFSYCVIEVNKILLLNRDYER